MTKRDQDGPLRQALFERVQSSRSINSAAVVKPF